MQSSEHKNLLGHENAELPAGRVPEDVVVAVDLLPHLGLLQDAPVSHHGAAAARRRVATVIPVVQQQPVSRSVEDGQSFRQR